MRRKFKEPQLSSEVKFLSGRKPALEVLKHSPQRVISVEIAKGVEFEAELRRELENFKRSAGAAVRFLDRQEFERRHQGVNAQGIAVSIKELEPIDFQNLKKRDKSEQSIIVALDGVTDPANLGSILRACEAFKVSAVILPRNNSVGLTDTARRVSVGASEFVPVCYVPNLVRALEELKKDSWWVAGAALDERAEELNLAKLPFPLVLVLGAEGSGLRALTMKCCDYLLKIPMLGYVQSLNVGQAAAVFLYELRSAKVSA